MSNCDPIPLDRYLNDGVFTVELVTLPWQRRYTSGGGWLVALAERFIKKSRREVAAPSPLPPPLLPPPYPVVPNGYALNYHRHLTQYN